LETYARAFTADDLMKQVFEEGRKVRDAEGDGIRTRGGKMPQPHP
jgi:hypothetical protein